MSDAVFTRKWSVILDASHLMRALVQAYDQISETEKAGAEDRIYNRKLFVDSVLPKVVAFWCQSTEMSPYDFPWDEDALTQLWIAWRKSTAETKAKYREQWFGPALFA